MNSAKFHHVTNSLPVINTKTDRAYTNPGLMFDVPYLSVGPILS